MERQTQFYLKTLFQSKLASFKNWRNKSKIYAIIKRLTHNSVAARNEQEKEEGKVATPTNVK